ncbi:flavodoxin [Clostridium acetobutylicum]|nr:flavodoxin [Clostridium acetobutylicum]
MKILLICDKDKRTIPSEVLKKDLLGFFSYKNFETKVIEAGRNSFKHCIGCFSCWIKTPGKCVLKDSMSEVNKSYINSDIVIYLTPIIFGQYSANIKTIIDRAQPYCLPFFKVINGIIKHPLRYEKTPKEIIIAYGEDVTKEEKRTFQDLIDNHGRSYRDVFYSLKIEDNKKILDDLKKII